MAAPTDDANPSPASGDGTAHQSPPVDPKEFYGYLFEADKKPTKLLDLLLRGIAYHIVHSIGDANDKSLTPSKMASFYKAVGGNYDCMSSHGGDDVAEVAFAEN
ncbi:hypothetical protein DH86_00002137 [Scytalidium sp. 3C]|nr:hypothetical protein DH86_00002137 [Scytalidium sp. 3C]